MKRLRKKWVQFYNILKHDTQWNSFFTNFGGGAEKIGGKNAKSFNAEKVPKQENPQESIIYSVGNETQTFDMVSQPANPYAIVKVDPTGSLCPTNTEKINLTI